MRKIAWQLLIALSLVVLAGCGTQRMASSAPTTPASPTLIPTVTLAPATTPSETATRPPSVPVQQVLFAGLSNNALGALAVQRRGRHAAAEEWTALCQCA